MSRSTEQVAAVGGGDRGSARGGPAGQRRGRAASQDRSNGAGDHATDNRLDDHAAPAEAEDEWSVSVAEAARLLGRDRTRVYALLRSGDLGPLLRQFRTVEMGVRFHRNTHQLLLERGASLEVKNSFGATVLGSTVCFALNDPFNGIDYPTMIELLIAAGAKVDATPNLPECVSEVLRRYRVTS